jgi:hypothetical protein
MKDYEFSKDHTHTQKPHLKDSPLTQDDAKKIVTAAKLSLSATSNS